MENPAAGGRDPPVDAPLTDGLPGNAGVRVNILSEETGLAQAVSGLVLVLNQHPE